MAFTTRLRLLGFLGIVGLFIGLRWNNYNAPLIRDEGEYAYAGQLLVQGIPPYQEAFIQKPPMVVYSYAFTHLLLPDSFWAPRLLAGLFIALTTLLLGYIVRIEFGEGFALPVTWLFTPMILLPGLSEYPANVEMFLLLPLMAAIALYCRARKNGHAGKYWFWTAFLAMTALLYKYTALPVVGFLFVAWFIEAWPKAGRMKWLSQRMTLVIGGGLAAIALELGYFLVHDHGTHLWECTILFNRYYAGSENFGFSFFKVMAEMFWVHWWILFFVPIAAFFGDRRTWFWAGLSACSLAATGLSIYSHYYVILIPFWALLGGIGLRRLSVRLADRLKWPVGWLTGGSTALVVLLLLKPDISWMTLSPAQFAQRKASDQPFVEALQAAHQVGQMAAPDDFVFVAGSEPEILCYSQRYSPSRFITVYPLMIPTPMARGFQQEAINDLQRHPPKLIIVVKAPFSWLLQPDSPPDLWDFIKNSLQKDYAMAGAYVNGPTGVYWTGTPDEKQMADYSLLFYRRKE